jgi:uncharacterized protein YjdB
LNEKENFLRKGKVTGFMKKANAYEGKWKQLKIKTLNRMIKGLFFIGMSMILVVPEFSLTSFNFKLIKAGIEQLTNPMNAEPVIGNGVWHNEGQSYDNSNNLADLYTGSGPSDFTFSSNSTSDAMTLNKQTIYPLADNGITGEVSDNKDIEVSFEWKFEKKRILTYNYQLAEKDVAILTIKYKNKTQNVGLLSSPLLDYTETGKGNNTAFLVQHYPLFSSVDAAINYTALAEIQNASGADQTAFYYKYGGSDGSFTFVQNAMPPWSLNTFLGRNEWSPNVFPGDLVKNWLQLVPTSGDEAAQYQMSFELDDESVSSMKAFKMPVTFQVVSMASSGNQLWTEAQPLDAKGHLYSNYTVNSKLFDKNKSYEIYAIRPGSSYEDIDNYLNSNLGWGTGLPTLKSGDIFSQGNNLESINVKEFAKLAVGSDTLAELTTIPEDYGDISVSWSAWLSDDSGSEIRADDPTDAEHQYVSINGSKIIGVKQGVVIIRAKVVEKGKEFTAQASLEIFNPEIPTGVLLDDLGDLEEGETAQAIASIIPIGAKGRKTWSSDKPNIAKIDEETGIVEGVSTGTATITVAVTYEMVEGNVHFSADKPINIVPKRTKVDQVTIEPPGDFDLYLPDDVSAGSKSKYLNAVINPSNAYNTKINWISSNTSVATVDAEGLVVPVSPGEATITATADENSEKSDSVKVTVHPLSVIIPEVIVVDGDETNETEDPNAPTYLQPLLERQTHEIKYTLYPDNSTEREVAFSIVSGAEFIELSSDGVITAKSEGEAIVQVASVANPSVYGRLAVRVERNLNDDVRDDATYVTPKDSVENWWNLSSRLLANVGGTDYFANIDRRKHSQVAARSLNLDPSINKNIRIMTASREDATSGAGHGNWEKYIGINERYQGDYGSVSGTNPNEVAARASGIFAETIPNPKLIRDIQGTALDSSIAIDTTSSNNKAIFANNYQGSYNNGNSELAQRGPVIYYTQNFAPNGHLGDDGRYDAVARGDNPDGGAQPSSLAGLKHGQGMYATNFREAVYMKYGDYVGKQYSSSASVVFPPLTAAEINGNTSNRPKTLKYGNGKQESIKVEYEQVGTFKDYNGRIRPMSAMLIVSNIVYGPAPTWAGTNGSAGEYRPSISFSNNLYSGFFYQNIKFFTLELKFYAADDFNSSTYDDYGKSINFAKKLTINDFNSQDHMINQDLPDSVIFDSIITFGSLNRSSPDNSQTEFVGAIATEEDTVDSLNLINGGYTESNNTLGEELHLLKIGILSPKTSIGLNGNAPGHPPDSATTPSMFKESARGTYYAGGYTDNSGGEPSTDFYFYDMLGRSTYPNGGVSFPLWGTEHKFLVGGSKAHTYNSLSSRSLRPADQTPPNKTVTTKNQLAGAVDGFYSKDGENGFHMRYDNDLDRFWQLEAEDSVFTNQYIDKSFSLLNKDYYDYYEDIPVDERQKWNFLLVNPNFVGAVVPQELDQTFDLLSRLYPSGFKLLDYKQPLLKYWRDHGKTGNTVFARNETVLLPVKNQRFVGASGVVNKNNPADPGNDFTYYINQPMIDFFRETEMSPTTIILNDHLPEGVEVTGSINVYDNLGNFITSFTPSSVVHQVNDRQKIKAILTGDKLGALTSSFVSQTKQYGDILEAGFSNEFTYEIPVRIKENYREKYRDYDNAAMVTFTYEDVGAKPRSHVTNAVQVATRGKAVFSFNKQARIDDGTGYSPIVTDGVEFKLYNQGVESSFPSEVNLDNEYKTDSNEYPIYSSNGYFEIILLSSDLANAGATSSNNVQWLILKEEKTNPAYDSDKLRQFEFGVYFDQVQHKFVFIRKNKDVIMRVSE